MSRQDQANTITTASRAVSPRAALAGIALVIGALAPAGAQDPTSGKAADLPFSIGERLTYEVRLSKLGGNGKGEFRVDGPVDVRGEPTYVLRSNVETRVGILKVANRTESWLDPLTMASLRFRKRERRFGSSRTEIVELFPEERRWTSEDGRSGETMSAAPLDELSFIYFLRTIPLADDSTYRFDRHFDAARNPTTVRVIGHETITTKAGTFPTVIVEMRVRDSERYGNEGVIRINLTEDHCRIPVRIQSAVPVAGTAVLTLESWSRAPGAQTASAPD